MLSKSRGKYYTLRVYEDTLHMPGRSLNERYLFYPCAMTGWLWAGCRNLFSSGEGRLSPKETLKNLLPEAIFGQQQTHRSNS
jgi:hypothetical protein